jgi:hypothetical protein
MDWWEWHEEYDETGSPLELRTRIVHRHVRFFLDAREAGTPIRIVSICAGQGRELLPVLSSHPRRTDVRARLVEIDPRNVAAACEYVTEHALDWHVDVVRGDAAFTDAYRGAVPADLVLVCGVFGCVAPDDARATIAALPQLCATGATVVWTRQRLPVDRSAEIRRWFADAGFLEEAFESPGEDASWVGLVRFDGEPVPLVRGVRLFTFRSERRSAP